MIRSLKQKFFTLLALVGAWFSAGPVAAQPATVKPGSDVPPGLVRINYHRFDRDYTDAGLWVWDARNQKTPDTPEVMAAGESDYGVYFLINPSDFGSDDTDDQIGFIPRLRRDWNFKDGADRFWSPSLGKEIWLIGNDPKIYTEQPDITPQIAAAYIDGLRQVVVKFSHTMPLGQISPATFRVSDATGSEVPIRSASALGAAEADGARLVKLEFAADLDFLESEYTVQATGYRGTKTTLRKVFDDPSLFFPDEPMGMIYTREGTEFRLFSPTIRQATLILFDEATGSKGRREIPLANTGQGVWRARVEGDLEGKFYRYRVVSDKHGTHEINDPMAINTTGDDGNARITDLRKTDPDGFRPIKRPEYGTRPTDVVIYQLHVRDFSIHPDGGAPPDYRGKYPGFAISGARLASDSEITTLLDHLKELGVTHVQIQPIHDFDNDEDRPDYNWGYMTAFFNSPEGMYSTDIRTEARIVELKTMIKALKEAGIGVILDVVYNHTGTQNTLELAAPGYYLRMRDDGSFWNGSGTGNELRSESPMGRRFIVESCKFWLEEYGFDGFRFDLMGLIDLETMLQLKSELEEIYPGVLIYGEPWAAAGPDGVGVDRILYKDAVRGTGLAAFNDSFRDAIKGSPDGNDPGYVQNGSRRDEVLRGIEGSINWWTADPVESINYVTVHDNLALWDKLLATTTDATDEERERMVMLVAGILGTSQGIMFLHGGVDFCLYKQGDHNSYKSGDAVNQIDWNRKKQYLRVHEYHRGIIAIRRAHPLFRMATAEEVRARLRFIDQRPAPETIVFSIDGRGLAGESWATTLVLINPTASPLTFGLPDGEFQVFALDDQASAEPIGRAGERIVVPARSMAILAQPSPG